MIAAMGLLLSATWLLLFGRKQGEVHTACEAVSAHARLWLKEIRLTGSDEHLSRITERHVQSGYSILRDRGYGSMAITCIVFSVYVRGGAPRCSRSHPR